MKKVSFSSKYKDNQTVKEFIENLSVIFQKKGKVLYNKRNVIKSFELDVNDDVLKEVVVKRYKKPNLIQKIIYSFFRESKAKRAFNNAIELRKRGIDTPQEIAYVEEWENGFFNYGYYISGSDNASPIRECLIEPENFDQIMASDFAEFAASLHEKGILHHDLNSTNVLYHRSDNGHYTFSVIDINRMDFFYNGEIPDKEVCFDNLTRFTGRMDLFEFVLHRYIEARGWNVSSSLQEAIRIKNKHDEQWRKRKAFLRKFKFKKK